MAADAPVQVVFDRPVTHASVAGRFTVSPAIPGCDLSTVFSAPSTAPCWIHWLADVPGFELLHEGAVFEPARRYTFTLAGGFADPQGDRNGLDHHWDLTIASAPVLASSTPADRATNVALDAPLTLSFNAAMDGPTTAAAIAIDPPVLGTRVVQNSSDHSRFVILPGRLLDPAIQYTVSVASTARGVDEQRLASAFAVRFATGTRLQSAHAVVLTGNPGEGATTVLMPSLSPAAPGEPVALPLLVAAPRCAVAAGCSGVPPAAPLQTYSAAAISPDGTRLAVVVHDAGATVSHVEVIDTVDDALVADILGGALPSWSPDGAELALAAPGGVAVVDARTGRLTVVAAAAEVTAAPLWSTAATLVISASAAAGQPGSVTLVDRALDAGYALPGAPPAATAAAVSPAGNRIALSTVDGGSVLVPAAGAAGGVQRVGGLLQPVGFTAEGELVAISAGGTTLEVVRISSSGDSSTVALGGGVADLASVRVAPDGRRLAWLAVDARGVRQALVANADGSGALAVTHFLAGGQEALAVGFSD